MYLTNKNKENEIQRNILLWYKKNMRNLPWRKLEKNKLPNPYFIFISEYMLQQTTVGTVKKKFEKFVELWPSINSLSKISQTQILSFWSGLGYYTRATNLLKSAKIIKKKYNSKIPKNYDDLIVLPGIGDYTAKAILGIAFNEPVMPIDANIERIFSRIYGFQKPLIEIKKKLKRKSNLFISKNESTKLIQAFMDYGSIICTPRNPLCENCSIKLYCTAYKKNLQNFIPFKKKLYVKKRKKYSRAYIICNEQNEIMVRKRSSQGMLASMLEVPNDKWVLNKKNLQKDATILKFKGKMKSKGLIGYSFSHFDLETEVFLIKIKKNIFSNHKWIKQNRITNAGFPTVMKKIIQVALE